MDLTEFDQIFRKYYPALCHYALSIVGSHDVAEDLVEELFIKVWQKGLKGTAIESFPSYLYRATRNVCLDHLRASTRSIIVSKELTNELADSEQPDLQILKIEVYRELQAAIAQLPPKCGQIITLSYLDGMPSKLIGEQMNISVSTVDNQKARGLKLLRKLLSKSAMEVLLSLAVV